MNNPIDFLYTSWDFFWNDFPSAVGFLCAWVVPVVLVLIAVILAAVIASILRRGKTITKGNSVIGERK